MKNNIKYVLFRETSDGNEGIDTCILGIFDTKEEAESISILINNRAKKEYKYFLSNYDEFNKIFNSLDNAYDYKNPNFILSSMADFFIGCAASSKSHKIIPLNTNNIYELVDEVNKANIRGEL